MAIVSAGMVKKTKKESTEWALGQPLVFPKKHNPTDVNPPPRKVTEKAIAQASQVDASSLCARRQFDLIHRSEPFSRQSCRRSHEPSTPAH